MHLLLLAFGCGTGTSSTSTSSLLRTDVEPAGENCASGGTAVSTGLDDDGDGVLSDTEVDHTVYVCNGADGATGADGANGADGADGDDGATSLMTTTDEPAGDNCAEGGVRVETGVDDDGDGVLDPEEVDDTAYVCDGASGPVSLVSISDEPEGANCAYGGQRLDTGVDTDENGVLDAGEITGTTYVCNGTTGPDGATAMVSTAEEPEGANCAAGGTAVSVGSDDDGDGVLSASEVDTTWYVCDGEDGAAGSGGGIAGTIVVGDYLVSNSVDAALLDGVEQITGRLQIYGTEMGDVELPDVAEVGSLYIGNSSGYFTVDSIALPSLTTVDDDVTVRYTTMGDWSGFDAVETVGGDLYLSGPAGSGDLDAFAGLRTIGEDFSLYLDDYGSTTSGFTSCSGFGALTSVPGAFALTSYDLPSITGFGALDTVGDDFYLAAPVTDLSGFGALRSVDVLSVAVASPDLDAFAALTSTNSVYLSDTALSDLGGLSGITSTTGSFSIYAGSALTSLSGLDNLTTVGSTFTVSGATALTDISALASLTSVAGLNFTSLTSLTDLDDLGSLTIASGGTLVLSGDTALTDISGLSSVSGSLSEVSILNDTALTNLDGLERVTYVGWPSSGYYYDEALYIYGNTALTDIDGLSGLTGLGYGYNYFIGNTNLCNSLVTGLRSRIGTSNILGTWSAGGNNTSC